MLDNEGEFRFAEVSEDAAEDINEDELTEFESADYEEQLDTDDWESYCSHLNYTPQNNCTWESGIRGEGLCIIDDESLKEELAVYGIEGIEYHMGKPDFGPACLMEFDISDVDDAISREEHRAMALLTIAEIYEAFDDGLLDDDAEAIRLCEVLGEDGYIDAKEGRAPEGFELHHSENHGLQLISKRIHQAFIHAGPISEAKASQNDH